MGERMGWHTRGYLPHFDGYGCAQHVVFRTQNSLTSEIVEETSFMSTQAARQWIDIQLDQSISGRIFNDTKAALMMEETIRHFDGSRFDLLAWCIMPNHLHALIVPLGDNQLGKIVRCWKMQATKRLGGGQVFAADYFERFVRDTRHLAITLAYIENNPVKAGLCGQPHDWPWSSASKKAQGWVPNTSNCPVFMK